MKDKNLKEQVDSLNRMIKTLELLDEMFYEGVTKTDVANKMGISLELFSSFISPKNTKGEPRVMTLKASNKIYKAITK